MPASPQRPAGRSNYRFSQLISDIGAVIDSLGVGRVHLLAHDWGSIQAWAAVTDETVMGKVASFTSISGPHLNYAGKFLRSARTPRGLFDVIRQFLASGYIWFFLTPGLPELMIRSGVGVKVIDAFGRIGNSSSRTRPADAYKEIADTDDPDAGNPATYPLITTRFRDPHGNLPGQPEDSLMGIMYNGEEPASGDVVVKNTGTWVFQGTGLSDGSHLPGILGYEVDGLSNDSTTPSNIIQIAHSPYSLSGQTFAGDSSVYQASSGAWVFAAGSIEWSWGLSNISNWGNQGDVNAGTQQITRNVLDQFINGGTITTPTPTPVPTTTPVPTATPTPGPGGTIALRSVATGSTSAASSLVTIPVPAGVVANDVMIAQVTVRGGAATTLTAPAGWSLVRRDNDGGGQIADGIYVHIVTAASEPASYTWNFSAGNDAAGGIAAYSGVNTAAPIDVSGGQANASSTSMTAPSITIPAGHNADRLLAVFATANSAAITLPGAVSGRWNFHAIGFGISAAMGDASVPSGATGNYVALQGSSAVNIGAQVALQPAPGSATPTPVLQYRPRRQLQCRPRRQLQYRLRRRLRRGLQRQRGLQLLYRRRHRCPRPLRLLGLAERSRCAASPPAAPRRPAAS